MEGGCHRRSSCPEGESTAGGGRAGERRADGQWHGASGQSAKNSGAAEDQIRREKGMMTFKDIMKADVHEVFMNVDEFSDTHMVNGVEMPVQLDTNEQIEREKRMSQNVDGIYVNQKLIYVAASDFGAMPKQGSTLNLDGKIYRVADAVDEGGIYSITIEANKAR